MRRRSKQSGRRESRYPTPRTSRSSTPPSTGRSRTSPRPICSRRATATAESDPSPDANLALDVYCYRLAQAIAAIIVTLNDLDTLVFTAGVGEHSSHVRGEVCRRLAHLSILINKHANASVRGKNTIAA